MKVDIKKELQAIGGQQLSSSWEKVREETPGLILPASVTDAVSLGYATAIGAFAAAVDVIMDNNFRKEMEETHRERTPEEQKILEVASEQAMADANVPTGGEAGDPGCAMDWYRTMNEELQLRDGHKLRPKNHRILNHTDRKTVIEMLMKGEVGFGNFRIKLYPEMSYEAAVALYEAHIRADRGTRQSLPLQFMTWFWEQGIKAGNPEKFGDANPLFKLLSQYMPDIDWAKWLNQIFGKEGGAKIPDGSTLDEAMMKLYELGMLNERIFWTSDLGAAIGGAKRRIFITGLIEIAVEIYAFLEGMMLGFIRLNDSIAKLRKNALEWRAQPKYMDMRIAAQCVFCAGSSAKALTNGDVFNLNYFSFAATMRHLWVYPRVQREHYDLLISISRAYRADAIAEFVSSTGIKLRPKLTVIQGTSVMAKSLDDRLHNAGCQSTRVRVLVSRYPEKLEPLVKIFEAMSPNAEKDMAFQPRFDALCESWYLSKIEDDSKAIEQLTKDLKALR